MLYLTIPMLLVLGLLSGYLYRQYRIRQRQQQERAEAIAWLQLLLDLLMLLQQRRGLMGAYLNGQSQLQSKLTDIAHQASVYQKRLNASPLPNIKGDKWRLLNNRISELLEQRFQDSNDSFNAHSQLFAVILDHIWCVAERYQLTTDKDRASRKEADQALRRLPNVAELLAQMRGLSTMTASRGYCSSAFRLRLIYLTEQVQLLAQQTSLSTEPAKDFLQLVDQEVINNERIQISPDQLFASATEAIETYLSQSRGILGRL